MSNWVQVYKDTPDAGRIWLVHTEYASGAWSTDRARAGLFSRETAERIIGVRVGRVTAKAGSRDRAEARAAHRRERHFKGAVIVRADEAV